MTLSITRTSIQNFALYLYFFSINIENFNLYGYGSISFFSGLIYLLAILPSIKVMSSLNNNLRYFLPIMIYFVWLVINSLINVNWYSARVFDVAFFLNIVFFFAIVNHASKDKLVLEKAFFVFSLGSIFTATLLFFGIGAEQTDEGLRAARTTFFNAGPNELAIKLVTGAIIIVSMIIQDILGLGKVRYLLALFLPLIFIAVLETGSRTALLVMPIAGLTWLFFRVVSSRYKVLALISGTIAFIAIFIPIIFFALQNQVTLDRIAITGGRGDFGEFGRFFLWAGFFNLLGENLLFGNGLSGFDLITFKYFGFLESPHNVLLEVLLYTGIVGLIIYALFIYRTVYASYRLYKDQGRLLPILLLPTIFAYSMALQALTEKICWLAFAYIVGTYLFNYFPKRINSE